MLNDLWAGMILVGIIYGALTGRMADVTNAALDSSKEAVTLCITMLGVMSFWVGLMEIAQRSGLIAAASRKLQPVVHFLFPDVPEGHEANRHITTNIIAYRSQYGSVNPAGIVGAGIVATLVSTVVGVAFAMAMRKRKRV